MRSFPASPALLGLCFELRNHFCLTCDLRVEFVRLQLQGLNLLLLLAEFDSRLFRDIARVYALWASTELCSSFSWTAFSTASRVTGNRYLKRRNNGLYLRGVGEERPKGSQTEANSLVFSIYWRLAEAPLYRGAGPRGAYGCS